MQDDQNVSVKNDSDKKDYVRAGKIRVVLQTDDARVQERTLTGGECISWHYHSEITDRFFCLAGTVRLELRDPVEEVRLAAGDSLEVPPGRGHQVTAAGPEPCRFLLVQGVGRYDRHPLEP